MSGWRQDNLGSVATLQRGFDLPTRLRRPGPVPIVSSSGVSGWHDRATVKAPGVVTGRYGTIGEVFFEDVDFWPLNTTLWVSNFHGNDERFIYYMLQRVDYVTHSGKSGVPGVNRNDLHGEIVSLPDSPVEQRAIALALSDVDDLIARLEQAAVKRQAIKQGMMQQLLTGRTRLPGFGGEWPELTVGALARVAGGGTPSTRVSSYWNGDIPWFTPAEIRPEGSGLVSSSERTITPEGLASSSATLLPAGSVLVTSRASIGNCAVAAVPATTNQGFTSLIPADGRSTWFLYYWVQQNRSEFESRSAGSTFLEISASKVAAIPVGHPSLPEQEAIGRVLRDADRELDGLKLRLAKARAIKEGMMQQLLAGRTRLPVKDAAA